YWLGAAVHFLGFDFSAALRLLTWLMLFAAGWGGYNLGRRYFNAAGAFITALAYLFAPYLIFNATQRGAFPELLGLALLPWALAAADVALIRRTPRSLVTAVFIFSLLMLSHNIIPNFGFVLLLGLALSRSQSVQPRALWQALWPALVVIGLTLLVTAFFWLPAYVELDFTQARRVDSPFSNWPRYDQHFVQPDDLLGFPEEPADPALTNPPLSLKLGAGQTLLALVGVFLSLALAAYRRPWFWMWALITAVCLFLAAPASGGVWRLLALPEFVQLPSRFLGPASLGVAVLAGIMGDWLGNRLETFRWPQDFHLDFILTTGFYGLGAIFVAVSGWFWLYPVLCPAPVAPHAATVAQATEWNSEGAVSRWGGDSLGETLPRWVDVLPDPDAFMPAYETGEAINRLMLPETAVLHTWTTSAKGDSYTLHLAEPTTLTYRTFYAPYWRAEINGQPAALSPRAGDGLIQVAVPVGEVALSFAFGPTPLRVWMLIVSGITAVLLLIWGWRSGKTAVAALAPPSRRQWGLFGGIVLVLWLLFAYVNLTDNPIRADRFVNGRLAGISNPLQISFGGEFTYLGYDGPASQPADQPICLTQYWTAENAIGVPYRFRLRLADEAGNVWHGPFARPASYADLPGKPGWLVGSYVRDAYEFTLLPGTPPGVYWLEASAFRSDTDLLLLPAGVETAVDPAWARVGQLQITPGNWEPTAANAQVDTFVPTLLAKVAVTELAEVPGLTLLGWTVPDVVWRPGELAQVDLLWQGDSVIWDEQVTAELALVNEDGEQVAETAVPIG
ncbi:MAG: hypothetical protein IAF02_25305, partial [Anaerolineae bacterium]|nr:hypothetical protein [Anaerolineae bacterium]